MITIIAILAALGGGAVMQAFGTAKQTRIKLEVDGLDLALKSYKEKYGAYPPCDLRNPAANGPLKAHVARAFPRYNQGAGAATLIADLTAAGVDTTNFRPDQALVFWLQGFSPDPANPFITVDRKPISGGVASGTAITVTPLFDFDPTRLWEVASTASAVAVISPSSPAAIKPLASYFPQGVVPPSSNAAPYVYWDAASYGTNPVIGTSEPVPTAFNAAIQIFSSAGVAVPYWSDLNGSGSAMAVADTNETWVNPTSYQIIACGMDGQYGAVSVAPRFYPNGGGYDISSNMSDDDNVTNFAAKARLGDAKP